MNQYQTACGGTINISEQVQNHLIAHPDVAKHLPAAIGKIRLPTLRKKFDEEIDMGELVGRSGVVKNAPLKIGERALFSLRANRQLPSRVANVGEFGDETTKIVVVARPNHTDGQFDLITSWIGTFARKEPWDRNIADRKEFQDCLRYWSSTALVYDSAVMGPVFESSWKDVLAIGKCRFS